MTGVTFVEYRGHWGRRLLVGEEGRRQSSEGAAGAYRQSAGLRALHRRISPTEPDDVWVTEVWRREADHDASLAMEGVPELIAKARPLIAGGSEAVRTIPLGGKGLTP